MDHLVIDFTFTYAPDGIPLFDKDLKVEVEFDGEWWRIREVGAEVYDARSKQNLVRWFDTDNPVVQIIINQIMQGSDHDEFDNLVREQAYLEAAE